MTVTAVAPATVGVKVGDYFYASWGYDQTNVDWFRVVGLTPKGVKIQKVFGTTVDDGEGGPVTYVAPTPEPYTTETRIYDEDGNVTWDDQGRIATEVKIAPIVTKRLQSYGGDSVYLPWRSYTNLYRWDGKPKYQTGSGWGH
jgi:hypothetical protein